MNHSPAPPNADYLKIPNYQRARAVDTLDALDIDPLTFEHDYVLRNRPCVLRRAALHWKACANWRSLTHLKACSGDALVDVHDAPVIEADPLLSSPQKKAWLKLLRLSRAPRQLRFADFLDEAVAEGDRSSLLFLYSVPLAAGGPLAGLAADIGTYPFLAHERRALLGTYPRNNAYFYRSSVTDWHYHATAEALQTQILGRKEVLLLPPNERVWSYMSVLHAQHLHLCEVDLNEIPAAREVLPFRAVLEPGDALYIPTYWWHFVSTRGHRTLGATVPTWWRTPLRVQLDPRFPALRASVQALLRQAAADGRARLRALAR